MQLLWGISVLLLCLGYIKASADFDCRRTSQSCVTGTCDDTSGICVCPSDPSGGATHTNKDCGLELSLVASDPSLCDPPCQNGGNCYNMVGSTDPSCKCSEAFYGSQCENARKEVECSGNTMTIKYTPISPFNGEVFIMDNKNTPECAFTANTDGTYTATFDYSECGVVLTADDPNPSDSTYTAAAVVQFNSIIERESDMKLTAECQIDGSGTSSLNNNIGSVSVDRRNNLTAETALTQYQPVSFELQDKQGAPLTPPVFLGDELRIYVPLADTGKYSSLRIMELITSTGGIAANSVSETLITSGCLTEIGEALVTGEIDSDTAVPAIIINFLAFRLRGSDQVRFDATVKVCEGTDTSCELTTPCQAAPAPAQGRKRRAAPDNEVILHETLTVLDPRYNEKLRLPNEHIDKPGKKTGQNADPQQCLQSTEIMVMVIVLIVAVVLLLVITTCLAVRFMKQRAQVKIYNKSDMPSGNDAVRIPRAAF